MQTETEKLFSPHNAPPLERCLYFRGIESTGARWKARTEEGDSFHRDARALFKGEKKLHEFPKARRTKMKWAIDVQRQYCSNPIAVEEQVDLYDEHEQWVTSGTADLAGWNNNGEVLSLIDWKPGDYIDRWGQIICYGLGYMDRHNEPLCQCALAYYKTRQVEWRVITYAQAEERVYKLIARLRGETGPEYHAINEWCSFCSVRMSEPGCPAWEENRHLLAQTGWPVELDARMAMIKSNPELVARFIIAYRRWCTLIDAHELEEVIRPVLEAAPGGKKYGLKLQSRGFSIVLDSNAQEPPQLEGGE